MRWLAALVMTAALAAGVPCAAQETSTQPASRPVVDQQRLAEFIAVIEGQNTPQARRLAARELLRQGWAETSLRLVGILAGPNQAAKIAIASELTDTPALLEPAFVEPLLGMLSDADANVRNAAGAALAAYRDGGVVTRLREMLLDPSRSSLARQSAAGALGLMPRAEAADALVEALGGPPSPATDAALRALERVTAMDFNGDAEAARRWWDSRRGADLAVWQQQQIERLVTRSRETLRRLRELEQRLTRALRDVYQKAPETERAGMLQSYLSDDQAVIRSLGLELVQSLMQEGRPLAAELVAQVRGLLGDPDPSVKAAAVRTVASLRDAADSDRFVQMLAEARNRDVRESLANGLGYVGGAGAIAPLLELVRNRDPIAVDEAAGALGRLAERGVLDESTRVSVVEALLELFETTKPDAAELRERVLWSLGRMAGPRCAAVFAAALDSGEAGIVRREAVRGLAALKDPAQLDVLVPLVADADALVRKQAIEVLGAQGATDAHLQAIWSRLASAAEPEQTVRQEAWRGALRLLATRTPDAIEPWLARLPDDPRDRPQRLIDLLALQETALAADPAQRQRVGQIHARMAAQHALLGHFDDAVRLYARAVEDLRAQPAEATRVALDLIRLALARGGYDDALAGALRTGKPALDCALLWDGLRADLESRLTPSGAESAASALAALRERPPCDWPSGTLAQLDALIARARELTPQPEEPASTQPDSAPATGPHDRPRARE